MAKYGNVEVEVEALKDAQSGIQVDLTLMRSDLHQVKFFITNLKEHWQNDPVYDAFSSKYLEHVETLMNAFHDLQDAVSALKTTADGYQTLENDLIQDAAKL